MRRFECDAGLKGRIFQLDHFLIANELQNVKFWDLENESEEPAFKTKIKVTEIFDTTVVKAVRWLAVATDAGLLSLDLDQIVKRDITKEISAKWNTISECQVLQLVPS